MKTNYSLTIGWLYPELMSTYGDRGNIIVLSKRLEWRGINVEVKKLEIGFSPDDLKTCDLLFMGGAQDKQQQIVSEDLKKKKNILSEMIENETPGLYICGAYQFLGNYYKEADGTKLPGLGILDLHTENPGEKEERLIGNISIETYDLIAQSYNAQGGENKQEAPNVLVGFENHGGRTYLGEKVKPLGTVTTGFGNNGTDKTEGAVYKNSFGSYLHGPILPKNPHFADYLLKLTLEKKYKKEIKLQPLNDNLEWDAHSAIAKRLNSGI